MSYHPPRVFRPSGSIGACVNNNPEDVKTFQQLIIHAGYNHIDGNHLRATGRCDLETRAAIIWYQRLLNMSPSGLVHPQEIWFFTMFSKALPPQWRPHTVGPLHVWEGQVTFDAEGQDYLTAVEPFAQAQRMPNFSRVLQMPPTYRSGVTLGRGYDMKERSPGEIYTTLKHAGIEEYKAVICSKAAYLKGRQAENFVKAYGRLVGEITYEQQIKLFEITYSDKKQYARGVYNRHIKNVSDPVKWENIDPKIAEVYIDSIYQGVVSTGEMAKIIANGATKSDMINFIKNDPAQMGDKRRLNIRVRALQ